MKNERYFLGADVGGTRTRVLICDDQGQAVGYAAGGPGNPDMIKLPGFREILRQVCGQALACAGIQKTQIAGAGLGVAGYDWPSQRQAILNEIRAVGLLCPTEIANDAIIGMIAGSRSGWGIGLVSGTGCNCWGWDETRTRIGRVTGGGNWMGEAAGASEMMAKAQQALAHMWTLRGPQTCLADMFIRYTGAPDLAGLLEGIMTDRYDLNASAAPLIFEAARKKDPVAVGIIEWGGRELGEMANAVIRQLGFQHLTFDLVLVGSTYDGGAGFVEKLAETVHAFAAGARLVRLNAPPVIGAVMLGMEQAGLHPEPALRERLEKSTKTFIDLPLKNGAKN